MDITCKPLYRSFLVCVGLLLAISAMHGQDKISLKTGQEVTGKILEVANGSVSVSVGAGTIPYPLANIAKVEMATPAEIEKARAGSADQAILLLEPLVKKFKGLPTDWVPDAMVRLAESYSQSGKENESIAVFQDMVKLYPGSRHQVRAQAGLAKSAFKEGKYDEVLTSLAPLIAEANKSFSPSQEDGRAYSEAFLIQGQALEKQGKLKEALESYLTVVTVFYQNPAAAKTAQEQADSLRKNNPQVVAE